ncbi:hypothetical protein, partial [uncultured Treponema sp.]|uniref:beta strand repeat-containing protein n=1 Tax=uncultured Treponema sp. TaxID=162155 RepID=UPI0025D948AC
DGSEISDSWAAERNAVIAETSATDNTTSGEVYWPVTYTNDSVPKGTYLLTCKFTLSYDHDSNSETPKQTIDSFYTTSVTVEPGSISKATKVTDSGETVVEDVDIKNLKQRYTVTYVNVKDDGEIDTEPFNYWKKKTESDELIDALTDKFFYNPSAKEDFILPTISEISRSDKCFVGWYTGYDNGNYSGDPVTTFSNQTGSKTYYAKWRDLTLYVAQTGTSGHSLPSGNDTKGAGTITSPYASLRKAIGFIQDYGGSALDWQIYIDGSVSGYSFSQIDEKAQSITVSGYTTNNVIADKLSLPDSSTSTPSTGSVLTIESGVSITIENLTITGGSGSQGAGLDIKAGADVTLKNVTVTENSTHETNLQDGGGILNTGTLRLESCTITGNTASRYGGGVFNSGTLYIYGNTVIGGDSGAGNSAKSGGGIYNDGNHAVYIGYSAYTSASENTPADFTGSISYNTATGTTAVTNTTDGSGGGAIFNQGTCIIAAGSDAAISNNSALYGAGVYNTTNSSSTPGVLSITGGTLSANTAGTNGNGGGIWSNGTLTVNGTTLSANTALSGNGGSIYVTGATTIGAEESPVTISGNTAQNGAGIYRNSTATFTLSHVTLSGNTASVAEGTASGGAIYNAAGDSTLTSCALTGNTATTSGGGVYNASGTLTVSGGTIGAENGANSAGLGGGVYNAGTLSVEGASICYNGTNGTITTTSGGGIYNSGTLTVTGTDAAISHNTASFGGGVNSTGSTADFTMSAGTVASNTAVNGAGVYNGAHSTFTMSGGSIASNTANTSGGGVYNAGSMFMYGSAVVGEVTSTVATAYEFSNSAEEGGGVYNTGKLYLGYSAYSSESEKSPETLSHGIYHNASTNNKHGGGIYNKNQGALIMNSGNIAFNYSPSSAGGVYVDSQASFIMTGGVISSNYADEEGGGVYNNGTMNMSGTARIGSIPSTIQEASSDSCSNFAYSSGGGIRNNGILIIETNNDDELSAGIIYNYANKGGGINSSGTLTIRSGYIQCNGAGNNKKKGIEGTCTDGSDLTHVQDD